MTMQIKLDNMCFLLYVLYNNANQAGLLLLLLRVLLGAKFHQIVKKTKKGTFCHNIIFFLIKLQKFGRKIQKFPLKLDSDFSLIAFFKLYFLLCRKVTKNMLPCDAKSLLGC
jgi:hypothetical protein